MLILRSLSLHQSHAANGLKTVATRRRRTSDPRWIPTRRELDLARSGPAWSLFADWCTVTAKPPVRPHADRAGLQSALVTGWPYGQVGRRDAALTVAVCDLELNRRKANALTLADVTETPRTYTAVPTRPSPVAGSAPKLTQPCRAPASSCGTISPGQVLWTCWRRRRDSNPRGFDTWPLSRRLPSATRTRLRRQDYQPETGLGRRISTAAPRTPMATRS